MAGHLPPDFFSRVGKARTAPDFLKAAQSALSQGRFGDARDSAVAASSCALMPGLHFPLGQMLARCLEPEALIHVLGQHDFFDSAPPQRLAEAGVMLSGVGAHAEAVSALERALAKDSDHAPSLYFRGTLAMFEGDLEAAESYLERCIAIQPGFGQAHWVLAMLRRATPEKNRVKRLRAALSAAQSGMGAEIFLSFALFSELHDLGDFGGAWGALERGNAAKRRKLDYSPANQMATFEALLRSRRGTNTSRSEALESAIRPIFIVGMHRSGTTLLETLLCRQPEVRDGGESYAFTVALKRALNLDWQGVLTARAVEAASSANLADVAKHYRESNVWRAAGKSVLTEKLPSNFLNLGMIAEALPEARFIHLVRDPMETCFSNYRTLFSDACAYSYDQSELAQFNRAYRQLMIHWRAEYPERIFDVDFSKLVADPETVMSTLFRWCGLSGVASALGDAPHVPRVVTTASAVQVKAEVAPKKPDWTSYAERLTSLKSGLSL